MERGRAARRRKSEEEDALLERRTSVPGERYLFFRGARVVGQRLFNAHAVGYGVPSHTAALLHPGTRA